MGRLHSPEYIVFNRIHLHVINLFPEVLQPGLFSMRKDFYIPESSKKKMWSYASLLDVSAILREVNQIRILEYCIWVRSWNCGCLVTWFCYQLIAKPGNKTAAVPWPDPYWSAKLKCFVAISLSSRTSSLGICSRCEFIPVQMIFPTYVPIWWQCPTSMAWPLWPPWMVSSAGLVFSCDQAALQMVFSVRLSVRLSHLFDYVPIIVSSWNFQELLPMTKVRSMQKVKVRGQRSRSQRSQPNLTVSGL